jgi:hypothetical protein
MGPSSMGASGTSGGSSPIQLICLGAKRKRHHRGGAYNIMDLYYTDRLHGLAAASRSNGD